MNILGFYGPPSDVIGLLQWVFMVLVLVALIVGVIWVIRRFLP